MGSTITEFRKRFSNRKSSMNRYGKGQRGICGEHLYAHFFEGHLGLEDLEVQIVDVMDKRETQQKGKLLGRKN